MPGCSVTVKGCCVPVPLIPIFSIRHSNRPSYLGRKKNKYLDKPVDGAIDTLWEGGFYDGQRGDTSGSDCAAHHPVGRATV